MTRSMDASEVESISAMGAGEIYMLSRNIRQAKCAKCDAALGAGEGYKFRSVRYGAYKGGYWCHACVGWFLEHWKMWLYNPFTGILFPIDFGNIPSDVLTEAWMRGGKVALFQAVLDARAKYVSSIR